MGRLSRLLAPIALCVLLAAGGTVPSRAIELSPDGTPIPTYFDPATSNFVPIVGPSPSPTTAPVPAAVTSTLDPPELRAVWVDAFHDGFKTRQQVDQLVDWARSANLNALFVQVRRRGDAYYLNSLEPRTEDPDLTPGFDALAYLIERSHQGPQPLQVHAWLATLPVWFKPDVMPLSPLHVLNLHNDAVDGDNHWLMTRDDGQTWAGEGQAGTYYLDPGNPTAVQYTVDVYANVVRQYDVDGVHLDQVRYYEGQNDRRWGYNPTSIRRFNTQYNRPSGSMPDPSDPDWMAWRREQVTGLVRQVYQAVKSIKPSVAVTAAVVGWGNGPTSLADWQRGSPYSGVFQDWRTWLQDGIVDYLLPMNYYREEAPQDAWYTAWVDWEQGNRGSRAVAPGVAAYLNSPEATAAQLARARATGALGIALYSYAVPTNGSGTGAQERAILADQLRQLFPKPAPVPAMSWLPTVNAGR